MSLYIPPPGGYPTGPESCDERDDCTPIISLSFASPPVVAYITACALCLTAAAAGVLRLGCKAKQLGHEVSGVLTQPLLAGGSGRGCEEEEDAVKRTLMVGRRGSVTTGAASPPKRAAATVRPKGGATPPAAIATPHSDTVVEELGSDRAPILRHFTGYRSVCTGSVAMAFVVGYSALLFSLYIVLLVDYYEGCQLRGPDAACFFGNYRIFGSYDPNSYVFFGLWCCSLVWVLGLFVFRRRLRNYFREPCSLLEADFVHVVTVEEPQVLAEVSDDDHSRSCCGTRPRLAEPVTHHTTVPVLLTDDNMRYVLASCSRFILAPDTGRPHKVTLSIGPSLREIRHQADNGLDVEERRSRLALLGPNQIPFQVDSVWTAVQKELISPFYIYQLFVFSAWLWFSYLFVAGSLILIVMLAAALEVWYHLDAQKSIVGLTQYETECEALVRKRPSDTMGRWKTLASTQLVVGDVLKIKAEWVLPCDIVLTAGWIIVDEASLTGEAMPVRKIALPPDEPGRAFNQSTDSPSLLYAGTRVTTISGAEDPPVGVVAQTGINSEKGQLVSHILNPMTTRFQYDKELPIALGMLSVYAAVCFVVSLFLLANNGLELSFVTMWQYALEAVSQIVSPLIPVVLLIGQQQAALRLKDKHICTVDPRRISISGRINSFCFDKTGTLTHSDLDFAGILVSKAVNPTSLMVALSAEPQEDLADIPRRTVECLATCHSVAEAGKSSAIDTSSQVLVGNRVDVAMFRATGWQLGTSDTICDPSGETAIVVQKRFLFSHQRQTMTVLVRREGGDVMCYTKGSYEAVARLCTATTVPANAERVARSYAATGCYVLATACRSSLPQRASSHDESLTRDEAEAVRTFEFLGLVLFRNELRPDSRDAMLAIQGGGISTLLVTGDNAQCAAYIAREVAMVAPNDPILLADVEDTGVVWRAMALEDSPSAARQEIELSSESLLSQLSEGKQWNLALTGSAFELLQQSGPAGQRNLFLYRLLPSLRIAARFTPEDKQKLVNLLISSGQVVGMCGDGGNDCGALRAAHAGLALISGVASGLGAEASMVAPFTSEHQTITAAVTLVKEGRGALVTSFACYKYLISQGLIFSGAELISSFYGISLAYLAYFLIDAVIVVTLSYCMATCQPADRLVPARPTDSLFSASVIAGVLGPHVIFQCVMAASLYTITGEPGYIRWPAQFAEGGEQWWELADGWEATVILFCFAVQMTTLSLTFSFGGVFRRPLWWNWKLCTSWLIFTTSFGFLLLFPVRDTQRATWLHAVFHIASIPFNSQSTLSPVWVAWQQEGNEPNEQGMPISLRARLAAILLAGAIVVASFEYCVVLRLLAKREQTRDTTS